ncbi:AAA family ATPase, partial [Clostridioides difficile]
MMIMIGLEYIKSDIQNIAEAIVSVLNIDVTIVNKELFRIAGTGVYIDKIGEKVDKYTAFKKSLTEQITILIDDPKSSDICRECYKSGACVEFAEVCCP